MSGDAVEQIKSRLNITDVVENYVKLQKAGKNFKALSPFTNEKTPSFFVSPDQGLYYCFSSGKGGDMFTFVQELEGVDFSGALKILAERAGVELKPEDPKTRGEKENLFIVIEAATRYYEKTLRDQPKVIEYLKSRGITGVSAKKFRIGYAQESWRDLFDHLSTRGFDPDIMEKAGLVIRSEKGYYDRFRGRIMFPIFNRAGIAVAFSGRVFHITDTSEDKTAKYVNSPETPLYNKSEILYGFNKAKREIRDKNSCIFVEGQVDLVLAHQAGTCNTVAVSGTALSRQHLTLVRRLAEDLIFAFDADDAGISAVGRGIDLALVEGFEVRVANMPRGADPADLINEDVLKWNKVILEAQHVIDFYLNIICSKNDSSRSMIRAVEENVLPYVAKLKSSIDQAHFISKIANKLEVAENSIWEEFKKVKQRQDSGMQNASSNVLAKSLSYEVGSHNITKSLTYEVVPTHNITKSLTYEVVPRKDKIKDKILGIFLWQSGIKDPNIDLDKTRKEYERITEDTDFLNKEVSSEEKGKLVLEVQEDCDKKQSIQKQIDDLFLNLEKEILKEHVVQLRQELKRAEKNEDKKKEEDLLRQIQEIGHKIEGLDNSSEDEN